MLHGFFKEAMISTTELRLSIQNFTLKLWLKTAKILAKMPSKCSWGFMSRDRSFQFPHRHTELLGNCWKGSSTGSWHTAQVPVVTCEPSPKKIGRSNHLKTTLTHHKILPDSVLRPIGGYLEKMACRIWKTWNRQISWRKGNIQENGWGKINRSSGVGIACHPTSQMCQWGPSCTRSQPSVASDVSRESSSWGTWSTSVIANKIILQENRSVEIVQAQLQTGNRKPK
jgi:hypothetical protein